MKIFTDDNIWLPHGWEFLPGWSLQFGVSSDHTGWIQIGLDGNGPWRIRSGREEKQKGNQQSGELAELVDSIGRSLPGLVFLSIFINGMKMQRNTPTKQRGKNRKANNSAKPRGKKNSVSMLLKQHLNQQWAFWAPNILIWREFIEERQR